MRVSTVTTPYDENGDPLTASWTAYFFGGAYEVRSDSTTIKYYSFGGQTIMNDGSGLKYLLTDHLGSVVAVTDEEGELLSQQRYLPFGGIRSFELNDITQTDYGYTGQRNLDSDIGLMDYKARFYSPLLNRFIQPDSIVPHPFNSQSYNRYSYVVNNPSNLIDPSGHCYLNSSIWIPNGQDGACSWSLNSSGNNNSTSSTSEGNSNSSNGGLVSPLPAGPACTINFSCTSTSQTSQLPDNGLGIIIMPQGSSPQQFRTESQEDLAYILFTGGFIMDGIEMTLQLYPIYGPAAPVIASFVDVVITTVGCFSYGECFYGRPTPNSPNMLVVNQDVIISTVDAFAPIAAGVSALIASEGNVLATYGAYAGTDIVTSGFSFMYDLTRMTGHTPSIISLGFSWNSNREQADMYLIITPP